MPKVPLPLYFSLSLPLSLSLLLSLCLSLYPSLSHTHMHTLCRGGADRAGGVGGDAEEGNGAVVGRERCVLACLLTAHLPRESFVQYSSLSLLLYYSQAWS